MRDDILLALSGLSFGLVWWIVCRTARKRSQRRLMRELAHHVKRYQDKTDGTE